NGVSAGVCAVVVVATPWVIATCSGEGVFVARMTWGVGELLSLAQPTSKIEISPNPATITQATEKPGFIVCFLLDFSARGYFLFFAFLLCPLHRPRQRPAGQHFSQVAAIGGT